MIKSLTIKNFQSHAHSVLDFCDGVNIICGEGDVGKSAILRAFNWARENRPTTTGFIRHGSGTEGRKGAKRLGTAEVALVIERDGQDHTVVRVRGHEVNSYTVDGQVLTTVGKDVPEQVSKVLQLGDINVQKQHDRMFLLADSPGQVAAVFNRYTNLDKVDECLDFINTDLRATSAKLTESVVAEKDLVAQIAKYSYLEALEEFVVVYEEVAAELEKEHASKSAIEELILKIELTDAQIDDHDTALGPKEHQLECAKELVVRLARIDLNGPKSERQRLAGVCEDIVVCTKRLAEIKFAEGFRHAQLALQKQLLEQETIINEVSTDLSKLLTWEAEVVTVEQKLIEQTQVIKQLETDLKQVKKQLADVDTCILCQQKLKTAEAKQAMLEGLK